MDQLKDVILSTLAEIQETPNLSEADSKNEVKTFKENPQNSQEKALIFEEKQKEVSTMSSETKTEELLFLESLRERFLVLFEGFQAPNNTALEAKVDLTLNFLEYVLSIVDKRIDELKGK